MTALRSHIFIDQLQPQTMCYLGAWIKGSLPRTNMAAQIMEVAPGLDVEALTDVALKAAEVQGGILVVERQFGYLEFHSRDIAAVKAAAEAVLEAMDMSADKALKPKVLASDIITKVDAGHAFLINRNKMGSMILAGETLFVLETEPAAYAILAANNAEKAATIKIVDYRMIGATGRLYLSGSESEVRAAATAAIEALEVGL
jgi:ethanolamine utilization microcompartment shell protein EutS